MPRPGRFTSRQGDPVPIVQEAGWAPWLSGWVWKILATTRIRSPDCPGCSK